MPYCSCRWNDIYFKIKVFIIEKESPFCLIKREKYKYTYYTAICVLLL